MPTVICPECDENIHIDAEAEQGSVVSCVECEAKLEIVGSYPIQLDPYFENNPDEYDDGFNTFENE